jgi:hypothetical protein
VSELLATISRVTDSDSSASVARIRTDLFRGMTPGEKTAIVQQMCEETRQLARAGIRDRHPDYSIDEVEHALHRLWVGDALADRAWPAFKHLRP